MTNEKKVAFNRICILTDLNAIIALAESQIMKARGIPIDGDDDYVDVVQGYADRVHEIMCDMRDIRDSKYLNIERADAK